MVKLLDNSLPAVKKPREDISKKTGVSPNSEQCPKGFCFGRDHMWGDSPNTTRASQAEANEEKQEQCGQRDVGVCEDGECSLEDSMYEQVDSFAEGCSLKNGSHRRTLRQDRHLHRT